MFPVLVWMYVRLAKAEEKQVQAEFGRTYTDYVRGVSAFFPHLGSKSGEPLFGPE
jgi:protein-S-isoprenylcysteine O-methyltransferase Ste14